MAERIVDAALSNKDGSHEAIFFLGDQFVVFNYDQNRVNDGVHPITDRGLAPSFTPAGVGTSLDAALKGRKQFSATGYHFKGTDYARFDYSTGTGDPTLSGLSAWELPSPLNAGVDAAFNGHAPTRDGRAYFFKGSQYARYHWPDENAESGFPKPISNMIGVPAPFTAGIDAAVDGEGGFESFSYMFREDRYLRFNWDPPGGGEPRADQPHASIQDNWPGLAELLLAGKAKTQALAWTEAAVARLAAFLASLSGTPFPFDLNLFNTALSVHFHVAPTASASVKAAAVSQILGTFSGISFTLKQSGVKFRFRTDEEALTVDHSPQVDDAYSFFGGTVNFTKKFTRRGPMNRAASVLHESVHVIDDLGGTSSTHIPEWYVTDAVADTLGIPRRSNDTRFDTRYDLMSTADSLHNPSSYAAFGQHVFFGQDTRFGEGHPGS